MTVAERLSQVRAQVAAAAERAGRRAESVRIVGVSKRQPLPKLLEAYDAGLRDFGENVAQELEGKAEALSGRLDDLRWHFIGRLQRNKINKVMTHVAAVHSVDSLKLAEALAARAGSAFDVYLQVNIGEEPQKGGVRPGEVLELGRRVAGLPPLRLRGLMTLPPAGVDPAPFFAQMQSLSRQLTACGETRTAQGLSMGMTHDFETAIAYGATVVRVGTAVFGPRDSEVI